MTLAELESAGLLKPKTSPAPKPKLQHLGFKKAQAGFPAKYPDYERCLEDHAGDKLRADASFLRISLERGFGQAEAQAELGRILAGSSRGPKYIDDRAKYVAAH